MALGLDETVQILLDGIRFNANEDTDPEGCYWVAQMAGWSSRKTKTQRTPKPVLPGSYRAPNPTDEKIISLTGWCIAPTPAARARAEDRLQALCPDPELLYRMEVTEEAGARFRSVELEIVDPVRYNETAFQFSIQVAAPDPMKYGTLPVVASTGLPAPGAVGLDWSAPGLDWADPGGLDWGTPGTSGALVLLNPGTAPGWPLFTISAGANPLVNPTITDQASGRSLRYSGTLLTGDVLVINTNPFARTVTLNGSGDRRPFLTRAEWFSVPANTSSAITFGADVYSPTALLSASLDPAYF